MAERMKWIIRHVVRGCGTLPTYGPHPGTPFLCTLVVIGGILAGLVGAIMMLVVFGSAYLVGAYERSREDAE